MQVRVDRSSIHVFFVCLFTIISSIYIFKPACIHLKLNNKNIMLLPPPFRGMHIVSYINKYCNIL